MKPIFMMTEMVKAILGGNKTVTRRVIKPRYRDDEGGFQVVTTLNGDFVRVEKVDENECGIFPDGTERYINPPYQASDVLYVRETWWKGIHGQYCYLADYDCPDLTKKQLGKGHKARPSIHMPREAARLFLRVTDMRVERLQDITTEDICNEGVWVEPPTIVKNGAPFPPDFNKWPDSKREDWIQTTARATYIGQCDHISALHHAWEKLWNITIKKSDLPLYGWDANPWVWVIEFERIDKPA